MLKNLRFPDEANHERGDAYGLWWIPVDEPEERQVLFGVGDRAPDAWATRWERARLAGEWLCSERLDETKNGRRDD